MTVRVYYNSHAPEDMYALIRQAMPAGLELATLDHDDDGERCARIADREIAIVAATPLTRAVIDAGTKLRLVHHQGVGYHDTVDTAALAERGIALALTPAGTSGAVAEHTVLLILATFRHLAFADAELRQGRWHINSLRPRSRELAGCTIGYVGMGRIGQETARRLKPFGTRGLYYDPQVTLPADTAAMLGVAKTDLGTLLHQADVVTLHVPSTPDTRHLIDAAALARMKPDAILVNTARGPVVDEGALAAALAGATFWAPAWTCSSMSR